MRPFDYDTWSAGFERRMVEHAARVRDVLAAGGTVRETFGLCDKEWTKGSGPFIEPWNSDPAYLAEHLMNRHRGFGTTHEIAGASYRLGQKVGA